MSLLLKKFVSELIEPFNIVLAMLLWFAVRRRHRDGRIAGVTAAVLLLVSAHPWCAEFLARGLESGLTPHRVHSMQPPPVHIVVLSGAYTRIPGREVYDEVNIATLRRTFEGVRLARAYPHAVLWLSGGDVFGDGVAADGMARLALDAGIPAERVRLDRASRDTHDQAVAVCAAIGRAPMLLVTSAYHLPRAGALFRHAGCAPTLAPTDFLAGPDGVRAAGWLPNIGALERTHQALHEYVGMAWSRLRGQI